MQYFQKNFLDEKLPISEVKLFISSPPLYAIDDHFALMFGRIIEYMREDGYILIDVPAGYQRWTVPFYHIGRATGWLLSAGYHFVEQAWLGEDHIFNIFRRYRNGFPPELKSRILEKCDTPKSHPCEFNPKVIRQLIEFYSEIGDTVLDGFCGTGTVPKEADKLNRNGIGCDVRPEPRGK